MTDKKILLALSSKSTGRGIIRFMNGFVAGDNVRIRLCILDDEPGEEMAHEEILDDISSICFSKSIPLRIDHLINGNQDRLFSMAAFSDLLVVEKTVLQLLAIGYDFPANSCASIAIPEEFNSISNILLITDGSRDSIQGVKQFFQIFPKLTGNPDVNWLSIESGDKNLSPEEERLLLDYLQQYSKNVAVLKVEEPITGKLLKPIRYDDHTFVVSNMKYLLSKYGEDEAFKPFFDNQSTLFFPSMTA
ncbi:MAG TPA: hypothetical protein VJ894_01010 [Cryomorphaceae bacterium]|nr:hypothetical protein [Cryomorphaceae bacterium]